MASIASSVVTHSTGSQVKLGGGVTGAFFAKGSTTATLRTAPKLACQQSCSCLGLHSLYSPPPAAFAGSVRGRSPTRLRDSKVRTAASVEKEWPDGVTTDVDVNSLKAASAPETMTGPANTRRCLQCQRAKPLADFGKTKSGLDGRAESCRACFAAIKAERLKSKLYHLALSIEASWAQGKVCRACGDFKEARDYPRTTIYKDGLYVYCRGCISEKCEAISKRVLEEVPRRCRNCGEVKAADNFHRRKGQLRMQCKACVHEYTTKRNLLLADSSMFVPREGKRCSTCGQYKVVEDFYADKRASDGFLSACKSCHCGANLARARAKKRPGSVPDGQLTENVPT